MARLRARPGRAGAGDRDHPDAVPQVRRAVGRAGRAATDGRHLEASASSSAGGKRRCNSDAPPRWPVRGGRRRGRAEPTSRTARKSRPCGAARIGRDTGLPDAESDFSTVTVARMVRRDIRRPARSASAASRSSSSAAASPSTAPAVDVFRQALDQAWEEERKSFANLTGVGGAGAAGAGGGDSTAGAADSSATDSTATVPLQPMARTARTVPARSAVLPAVALDGDRVVPSPQVTCWPSRSYVAAVGMEQVSAVLADVQLPWLSPSAC